MAPPNCDLLYGVEQQFYVNHVAHYILIEGLLERLTDTGRVVIISSDLHKQVPKGGIDYVQLQDCSSGYDPIKSYAVSKFANVAYARALSRQFAGSQRRAVALHPGVIYTNLLRYQNIVLRTMASAIGRLFLKSVEQGASTPCYAAVHPEASATNTCYMENCREALAHPDTASRKIQERLLEESALIAIRE
jgi:WW domain-containing oxidoreductase